jgi:hypothetical protein
VTTVTPSRLNCCFELPSIFLFEALNKERNQRIMIRYRELRDKKRFDAHLLKAIAEVIEEIMR